MGFVMQQFWDNVIQIVDFCTSIIFQKYMFPELANDILFYVSPSYKRVFTCGLHKEVLGYC